MSKMLKIAFSLALLYLTKFKSLMRPWIIHIYTQKITKNFIFPKVNWITFYFGLNRNKLFKYTSRWMRRKKLQNSQMLWERKRNESTKMCCFGNVSFRSTVEPWLSDRHRTRTSSANPDYPTKSKFGACQIIEVPV